MKKYNSAIKRKKTSEEVVEDITEETVRRNKIEGIYFK
jgi:hypothetical protein